MELTLTRQAGTQVLVTCDGQPSHTFDLQPLLLKDEEELFNSPVAYGEKLYEALFRANSPALHAIEAQPDRLLLVTIDNDLDSIPWEYVYGPDRFLVEKCRFIRGLPTDQRIDPPTLANGLRVVAIPSNPLSHDVEPLNIDGEWIRLREIFKNITYTITLERTRPPTLECVRKLVVNRKELVIHFMGHGGQDAGGAFLYFEKDNGDLDLVTAEQFIQRVPGSVFLVTLNACVSARPGPTLFGNMTAALVRKKIPYALGMRLSVVEEDALTFARTFYSELALGSSVEEALFQARLTLARSVRPWAAGVPVLYTSLASPATGFPCISGAPVINEYHPYMEVNALPRVEGTFQGRIEELKKLGELLTGDDRFPVVTVHGGGGQGKTALVREAVERFAYAWSGGVWATTLEYLPDRESFVIELARFLRIPTQEILDYDEIEKQVVMHLRHRRTLIVLDNAETLVEAVKSNDQVAVRLTQFIREKLPRQQVGLLVTSRSYTAWSGEFGLELEGLTAFEGIKLFWENAPNRQAENRDRVLVWELSKKVGGHPLSLRLLGRAFNASQIPLATFVGGYEAELLKAEDKYKNEDHRHRTLYASIETSISYLDKDARDLLSGLWVFQAPFLLETAVAIFNPGREDEDTHGQRFSVRNHIHTLWQQGLLTRKSIPVGDEALQFYSILPSTRPYLERHLEQAFMRDWLLTRFGAVHAHLLSDLYDELDKRAAAVIIAQQSYENFERNFELITSIELGQYLLHWAWVIHRLGNPQRGLQLLERVVEIAQGQNQPLELEALYNMAMIDQSTGQWKRAVALYEQILPIWRVIKDRLGEAAILNNMAEAYRALGQPQRALELHERALPIMHEEHDAENQAGALSNLATLYQNTGQPQRALELYEQSLQLLREAKNRTGEATLLTNIAVAYNSIGQSDHALELYNQALPLRREMGDRAGEALTLIDMGQAYRALGQPRQALELYEQALPITREVHSTADEATVLNSMAGIYYAMGQLKQALELYEQVLPLRREVGDRSGEAYTLDNMAVMYYALGQPRRSLELYEQVLPLRREVGDRSGEALTLTNMGGVYQSIGQLKRALEHYEQASSIRREVNDLVGEADTLCRKASLYQDMGQSDQALEVYQQALSIYREANNITGEANTLANLGTIYYALGLPRRALELYEQALSIHREVNDRLNEAVVLSNISAAYQAVGQAEQALEMSEQALSIQRELGRRAGEAYTLINMAMSYNAVGQPQQALVLLKQALPIMREVEDPAGEAAVLANISSILYQSLNRSHEASIWLKQAIAKLVETDLPQDATGTTVDMMRKILGTMREGIPLDAVIDGVTSLPEAYIQQIVTKTVSVMTVAQDSRDEWREEVAEQLRHARQRGVDWQPEVEFFSTILSLLDGQSAILPKDHPYAQALTAIQVSIPAEGLPFDTHLVPRSIAALKGNQQDKIKHMQYLAALDAGTTNSELKALINAIQLASYGEDLSGLGQHLGGVYRLAWNAIISGIKTKTMQKEDDTMRILQVGKPYIEGETSLEEAVKYNWSPDEHVFLLFFRNPQPHEEKAVRSGKAEFALVIEQDIIFMLFRFHGAHQRQQGIDWSDAPYSWHLLPATARRLPPEPQRLGPEEHTELHIVLINANTGIVFAIRKVRLSHEFTVQLYQAIRAQASRPFDKDAYLRQLDQLYTKYPSAKDLLPRALARCEDSK
jgi:tetratricopeptide (TPR) repeat protein